MIQQSLKELISNEVQRMQSAIKLIEFRYLVTLENLSAHLGC